MLTKSYCVVGARADGSRLTLWQGDSSGAALKTERRMRVLGGSYTDIYIEKNGKRWIEERWTNRAEE